MKCLCCGKLIKDNASEKELSSRWHSACVKRFFGTKSLPDIDITEDVLEQLAIKNTNKGLTVPGVQKKLSLHLENSGTIPRLTLVNHPTGYILKPQTKEYPCLPEAEYLVMMMAEKSGIKTVPHALIYLQSQDSYTYITKRIDRADGKILAMEDFCQLSERLTEDKYKGSYEQCSKIIKMHSSRYGLDMTEFFIRLVFSYIVGNSDMHMKNFSLIETDEGSGTYILSDAYDMLPVNSVNPADTEQLALTLNGKKNNLHKNDFLKLATTCDIDKSVALRLIDSLKQQENMYLSEIEDSYITPDLKENLKSIVTDRIKLL